jgi:hypothetical protein
VALYELSISEVEGLLWFVFFKNCLEFLEDESPLELRDVGIDKRIVFTFFLFS